jgi:predicted DNA-binding transcriptional regulator YafY
MAGRIVYFDYRNHRGEIRNRKVCVDSIEFLPNPGYGYQPGWFLSGYDYDKQARRSFALSGIKLNDKAQALSLRLGPIGPM